MFSKCTDNISSQHLWSKREDWEIKELFYHDCIEIVYIVADFNMLFM